MLLWLVLVQLRRELLAAIPGMDTASQLDLLHSSFAYLPIEELRDVPIEVLRCLVQHDAVPEPYWKKLGTRPGLLPQLPLVLRRHVWAFDKGALRQELCKLLDAYTESREVCAIMSEFGPASQSKGRARDHRASSSALEALAEMIGDDSVNASIQLYQATIDEIERRWNGSSRFSGAWCTLRAELLLLQVEGKRSNHRLAKLEQIFAAVQ